MGVETIPPMERLTVEEKLQLMEQLWDNLIRFARRVPSIEWQKQILAAGVRRFEGGEQGYLDWEGAKELLKNERK